MSKLPSTKMLSLLGQCAWYHIQILIMCCERQWSGHDACSTYLSVHQGHTKKRRQTHAGYLHYRVFFLLFSSRSLFACRQTIYNKSLVALPLPLLFTDANNGSIENKTYRPCKIIKSHLNVLCSRTCVPWPISLNCPNLDVICGAPYEAVYVHIITTKSYFYEFQITYTKKMRAH